MLGHFFRWRIFNWRFFFFSLNQCLSTENEQPSSLFLLTAVKAAHSSGSHQHTFDLCVGHVQKGRRYSVVTQPVSLRMKPLNLSPRRIHFGCNKDTVPCLKRMKWKLLCCIRMCEFSIISFLQNSLNYIFINSFMYLTQLGFSLGLQFLFAQNNCKASSFWDASRKLQMNVAVHNETQNVDNITWMQKEENRKSRRSGEVWGAVLPIPSTHIPRVHSC